MHANSQQLIGNNEPIKLPSRIKNIGHIIDNKYNVNQKYFCGRSSEIQKMMIIFNKKIKNNILLVGQPGVGKTSLVETFTNEYNLNNVFVVECAKLLAETEYRGSFENKVTELMNFALELNLILFFDEIHVLMNLGKTTGGISITDILKPYLLDNSLMFIGATTLKEACYLLNDDAFNRRFTSIYVDEPTDECLINIKKSFEKNIVKESLLSDGETLDIIFTLRNELNSEFFPDKLIDFIDYYYSSIKINNIDKDYKSILKGYINDQRHSWADKKC